MQPSLSNQIIGLAGLCQAVSLLQNLARHNKLQPELYHTTLASVANLNPESPLAVYGDDPANLAAGLQLIIDQLGDNTKKDVELSDSYNISPSPTRPLLVVWQTFTVSVSAAWVAAFRYMGNQIYSSKLPCSKKSGHCYWRQCALRYCGARQAVAG